LDTSLLDGEHGRGSRKKSHISARFVALWSPQNGGKDQMGRRRYAMLADVSRLKHHFADETANRDSALVEVCEEFQHRFGLRGIRDLQKHFSTMKIRTILLFFSFSIRVDQL
jgi:hypothetical protein